MIGIQAMIGIQGTYMILRRFDPAGPPEFFGFVSRSCPLFGFVHDVERALQFDRRDPAEAFVYAAGLAARGARVEWVLLP